MLIWEDAEALNISVVFTWYLNDARKYADLMKHRRVRIGGPAVELSKITMPGFWLGCQAELGGDYPGVLQRFNHLATRTSVGCTRRCKFCSVPLVTAQQALRMTGGESRIVALEDWPDLPVLADDNLLLNSIEHFDRVCDRLEKHGWCDFNQGIDSRALTEHHAERIARIKRPKVRMALDNPALFGAWESAFEKLRKAGVAKRNIHSYCIIADTSAEKPVSVEQSWEVCRFVEDHGVKPYPMWYHPLNAMQRNIVTKEQAALGWNDYERRKIMQWFYQHKVAVD